MATVLLVDDDRNFASALSRLLLRDGYLTRVAESIAEALEQTSSAPAGVDLVIADLKLFRESGFDLLLELHRSKPHLPVILVSASPDARSYLDALRLGAYEYLAKPFDIAELRQLVQRALAPGARVT